jgi:hypothetical protein
MSLPNARRKLLKILLKGYRKYPGSSEYFDVGEYLGTIHTNHPNVNIGIMVSDLIYEGKIIATEALPQASQKLPRGATGIVLLRLNPEKLRSVEDEVGVSLGMWMMSLALFVFLMALAAYASWRYGQKLSSFLLPATFCYLAAVILWAVSSRAILGKADWRVAVRRIKETALFWTT